MSQGITTSRFPADSPPENRCYTTADVLLIFGMPGTGKTTYSKWLVSHGWGRIQADGAPRQDMEAIRAAILGDATPFLKRRAARPAGFVVEWGHPIPEVVWRVVALGYNAWFFGGDRNAALLSWLARHTEMQGDAGLWHYQVACLEETWPEVCAAFGPKMIATVFPGPRHLPPPEIHKLLGLPPVGDRVPRPAG